MSRFSQMEIALPAQFRSGEGQTGLQIKYSENRMEIDWKRRRRQNPMTMQDVRAVR